MLQFIDSARFMASSLAIHIIKCKFEHDDKKCFLNAQILKMIYWNTNVCVVTKIINTSFIKS